MITASKKQHLGSKNLPQSIKVAEDLMRVSVKYMCIVLVIRCLIHNWVLVLVGNIRKVATCSISIQKMARGWLVRRKAKAEFLLSRILHDKAILIQKRYRGKFVRSYDMLVLPAILALRVARLHKKRTTSVIILQCCWRNVKAKSRLKHLRRNFMRRRYFSILIQSIGRSMLARIRLRRFKLYRELHCFYRCKMAIRVQCFFRQWSARRELDRCLQLAGEKYLMQHQSAVQIQSVYRGWLGFCEAQSKKLAWNKAAVVIERIFRGKRVPKWQQLKMNAVLLHVLERANLEHAKSLIIRNGYTQSSIDESAVDESSFPRDGALIKYVFGHSFTTLRCLIYWPDDGLYKSGASAEVFGSRNYHLLFGNLCSQHMSPLYCVIQTRYYKRLQQSNATLANRL